MIVSWSWYLMLCWALPLDHLFSQQSRWFHPQAVHIFHTFFTLDGMLLFCIMIDQSGFFGVYCRNLNPLLHSAVGCHLCVGSYSFHICSNCLDVWAGKPCFLDPHLRKFRTYVISIWMRLKLCTTMVLPGHWAMHLEYQRLWGIFPRTTSCQWRSTRSHWIRENFMDFLDMFREMWVLYRVQSNDSASFSLPNSLRSCSMSFSEKLQRRKTCKFKVNWRHQTTTVLAWRWQLGN